MRVAGGDEALREDHGGVVEARLKIAVLPLDGRFGGGLAASQEALHLVLAPMQLADLGRAAGVDVAFPAGIGAGWPQAVGGVDGEGQGFEFDVNAADGVLRGLLVHRRHRQNRIADEHRLVGQDAAVGRFHRRQVVGGEHPEDAVHGQRCLKVQLLNPGVRHGADQQAREAHAISGEILRVLGLAGDLAEDVGRREVLADEFVGHVACPEARITALR